MKRTVAILILIAMLTAALSGCAETADQEQARGLQVGFAREKILPDTPVGMAGYSNESERVSKGYLDILYASCLAVSDEQDHTVLIFGVDLITPEQAAQAAIPAITRSTGIPKENIYVNATHTHSGPSTAKGVGLGEYLKKLETQLLSAAQKALADRSAATLSWATVDVEGLSFQRHYLMEDGSYAGVNYNTVVADQVVGHAAQRDPQMRLVQIRRPEKPSVVVANWQAHAVINGGYTKVNLSGDFPAATRDSFESKVENCYFMYLQGCAGDIDPRSSMPEEEYPKDYKEYGSLLADHAIRALENTKAVEGDTVKTKRVIYTAQVDHSQDHLSVYASQIWNQFQNGDRAGATEEGKKYGFHSVYHAGTLITRPSMGQTIEVELNAITLGELAIVTTPVEYFNQLGVRVRENSPYEMTFTLGYTNDRQGYMPSSEAYDYGCYEADITPFAKGTGELVADKLVSMLKELKES